MDFAQRLRDALGIEPGVDDDTFVEYVAGLQQFAESNDAPNDDQEGDGQPATPVVTPQLAPAPQSQAPVVDVDALVAARVAASQAVLQDVAREQSAEIAALKKAYADREAAEAIQVRDKVLASAVADAKITVAEAKPDGKWGKRYDAAPEVTASILADMSPGVAMNIAASGHSGTTEAISTEDDALYNQWFPSAQGGGA